jgi:hypothetical protein
VEALLRAVRARVGVAYLETWEDDRARAVVEEVARRAGPPPRACLVWSATEGLTRAGVPVEGGATLAATLRRAAAEREAAVYLVRDPAPWLGDPVVRRALRDCFAAARETGLTVVLTGVHVPLPEELLKEVVLFRLPLPGAEELQTLVEAAAGAGGRAPVDPHRRAALVNAVRGLTLGEAGIALRSAFLEHPPDGPGAVDAVLAFKRQIVLKLGMLDFVPDPVRTEDVGGLESLKAWLAARRGAFGPAALARALKPPKGLLVMGVPGCGKSLSVRLVAGSWDQPLLRLDLAAVYSGLHGNPEVSLQRALAVAEAVAPCVLWIDEIEKGVAGLGAQETGVAARVFGTFLTWMQEKSAAVFVAATANMIDLLPPEVIRKGRFDEIFFIDLPSLAERTAIWEIHLRRLKVTPRRFPAAELAKMSDQWTASEIEQTVVTAVLAALAEEREPGDHDLLRALGQVVPLSKTMSERIREIRRWASDRAVAASPRA